MTNETVIYNQKPQNKTFDVIERTLELQKLILDPSYPRSRSEPKEKLISRSAGVNVESTCSVQKQLELQKRILNNGY